MTIAIAPPQAALTSNREVMEAAIAAACTKIAPLWPLKHFVAVNPFLGFSGQGFGATAATLRRIARTEMLMPRGFYREAHAAGAITDADFAAALARNEAVAGAPGDIAALKAALARDPAPPAERAVVATVAEVLDMLAGGDRFASRTAFMVDEIGKCCAAWFDEGQASWTRPDRALGLYRAWRAAMRHDRNPEAMGIKGFRTAVASLPDDPVDTIVAVVEALGIPGQVVDDYLHRSLFDIGGWAAYARYLVWDNGLYGRPDDTCDQATDRPPQMPGQKYECSEQDIIPHFIGQGPIWRIEKDDETSPAFIHEQYGHKRLPNHLLHVKQFGNSIPIRFYGRCCDIQKITQ